MKYEYEEGKKSQVESFTSENPDFFLSLRWFKMYEHMLYEDFGGENIIKPKKKNIKNCKNSEQKIFGLFIILGPIIVLAHEFFDALPVNIFVVFNLIYAFIYNHLIIRMVKFKYDKEIGWCEKLVNVSNNKTTNFEFILSDGENENVRKILKPNQAFSDG